MSEADPTGRTQHEAGAKKLQERLHELLNYDEETGVLTRRKSVKGYCEGVRVGANHIHGKCRYVTVDGRTYKEHRLIWIYVYGCLPSKEIDHINGNGLDNSLANLREASHAENSQNRGRHKDNKTGFLGVTRDVRRGNYQARICVSGKTVFIGRFKTPDEAHAAYQEAKARHHSFSPEVRYV
jgi:hypothetical protein